MARRLGRAGEALAWRWLRGIHNGTARTLRRPRSPRPAEAGWMAAKGIGWLVRRSTDLVPVLMGLAVREWLAGERREPTDLNVLSRPSGNLRRDGGLPKAGLKVRSR